MDKGGFRVGYSKKKKNNPRQEKTLILSRIQGLRSVLIRHISPILAIRYRRASFDTPPERRGPFRAAVFPS